MKSKEEIKQWLLENCVDEDGDLALIGLDFSDFDGDVWFACIKVKRDLYQPDQEVRGSLIQDHQTVEGDLFQQNQKVKGDLFQYNQKVSGKIFQGKEVK